MVLLAFAEGTSVQLVPDGTLFIHIALILIMIWILNRTFFRPINRIIEAREKNKGGRLGESEMLLKEVGEKEAKYNESLRDARSKGYESIEAARASKKKSSRNSRRKPQIWKNKPRKRVKQSRRKPTKWRKK
jgi:F0F1-type ATP synthase membrane subunit b/b'